MKVQACKHLEDPRRVNAIGQLVNLNSSRVEMPVS